MFVNVPFFKLPRSLAFASSNMSSSYHALCFILYFSRCILCHCLPLLTHTLSYIIHLLMTCNYRCLLPQIEYLGYFTLCSHAYVMSKLGQLRTCLNLMTRQNSCLSPLKELSISITYLLRYLWKMLKFLQTVCEKFESCIRLSSYYECTCLQYCSAMLL